jgi:hypothetical protein
MKEEMLKIMVPVREVTRQASEDGVFQQIQKIQMQPKILLLRFKFMMLGNTSAFSNKTMPRFSKI